MKEVIKLVIFFILFGWFDKKPTFYHTDFFNWSYIEGSKFGSQMNKNRFF